MDRVCKGLLMDCLIRTVVIPTSQGQKQPAPTAIVPQVTKECGKQHEYEAPNTNGNFCCGLAHVSTSCRATTPLIIFSTAAAMINKIQEKAPDAKEKADE